ncbi:hypothetical protein CYMTET_14514 [Cymbomonas tetramitiformis]|uniref:LNR domain-containing protein n=1 Tax=Cymbomonas tetramitiformis TaxID=36881 RepID=A0AAE0GGB4_9CHLO|nr:hypothetical protein CYMTET_14514 [Cymbomonas tetramitiformis]
MALLHTVILASFLAHVQCSPDCVDSSNEQNPCSFLLATESGTGSSGDEGQGYFDGVYAYIADEEFFQLTQTYWNTSKSAFLYHRDDKWVLDTNVPAQAKHVPSLASGAGVLATATGGLVYVHTVAKETVGHVVGEKIASPSPPSPPPPSPHAPKPPSSSPSAPFPAPFPTISTFTPSFYSFSTAPTTLSTSTAISAVPSTTPVTISATAEAGEIRNKKNNGQCDGECNNPDCGFDGGDCCKGSGGKPNGKNYPLVCQDPKYSMTDDGLESYRLDYHVPRCRKQPRNQYGCGCCYAFAAITTVNLQMCKAGNSKHKDLLSASFVESCTEGRQVYPFNSRSLDLT